MKDGKLNLPKNLHTQCMRKMKGQESMPGMENSKEKNYILP
jgi:hypothetical protein